MGFKSDLFFITGKDCSWHFFLHLAKNSCHNLISNYRIYSCIFHSMLSELKAIFYHWKKLHLALVSSSCQRNSWHDLISILLLYNKLQYYSDIFHIILSDLKLILFYQRKGLKLARVWATVWSDLLTGELSNWKCHFDPDSLSQQKGGVETTYSYWSTAASARIAYSVYQCELSHPHMSRHNPGYIYCSTTLFSVI